MKKRSTVTVKESQYGDHEYEVYYGNDLVGYIEVKDIDYHRGTIPVFRGKLYLDSEYVWDFVKKARKPTWKKIFGEKADDEMHTFLDYLQPNEKRRFAVHYVEFLYPGSGGLGLNVDIDYPREHFSEEIQLYLEEVYGEELEGVDEETIEHLIEEFRDLEDKYLDLYVILADGLREIYKIYEAELEAYDEDYDEYYEDEDYHDEDVEDIE